jgi:hypothetical protein
MQPEGADFAGRAKAPAIIEKAAGLGALRLAGGSA